MRCRRSADFGVLLKVNPFFTFSFVSSFGPDIYFFSLRRNKDVIFPEVPEPRDLISDISDNNNKVNVLRSPDMSKGS